FQLQRVRGVGRIQQDRDTRGRGDHLLEEFKPLVTTPRLKSDSPVMLPPGRARLATSPVPTGSAAFPMTIGITLVALLAAWSAGAPTATKISTARRTSSVARLGNRS